MKIAIVIIAYNRVKSLERLLDTLCQADYGNDKVTLITSIDHSNTDIVEEFADKFIWPFGEKRIKKHAENLGLKKHILSQGEEFSKYDALIILEDDIIVSPAFYKYSLQTINAYYNSDDIAGISLYSFPVNYLTGNPFVPYKNSYDCFIMNTAQSWGQIWMKRQWFEFYEWYLTNESFDYSDEIPGVLFSWHKSWLKYHTRYCAEKGKYFIYPYFSFSSNCGEAGTHSQNSYNNYQTVMQTSLDFRLRLPDVDKAVKYDVFFENKDIYSYIGLSESDCCIDLNGSRQSSCGKRYWLSTQVLPYQIIKSYGLKLRPIEQNIIAKVAGNEIFLYDTYLTVPKNKKGNKQLLIQYRYRITDIVIFCHKYGVYNILSQFGKKIIGKFFK